MAATAPGLAVLPGAVLLLPDAADGLHPGVYVLLSNPDAPMVRLCRACLGPGDAVRSTGQVVYVGRETMRFFQPMPDKAAF